MEKTKTIQIRVSSQEKSAIRARAKSLNLHVSEYLLSLHRNAALPPPPSEIERRQLEEVAKEQGVLPSIYPTLDQHSCFETNRKGDIICSRGGAACDFRVPCTSSLEIAIWVVKQLPFDRLYFYGHNKPIHVSYNSDSQNAAVCIMTPKTKGQGYIPRNLTPEHFLEQFQL
ncbi:plasmid mobilization protein [Endozoicomonas acroporae]|uniref:plasmid mobilization protein n=1 Tax=Endozoicomonas acroporae TaxID=1701104 RepID=UPI003D7A66FC